MKNSQMMKTILTAFLVLLLTNSMTLAAKDAEPALPDMSFLNTARTTDINAKLIEIFPPGTSRTYVEKALIEKAGALPKGKRKNVFNKDFASNAYQYSYQRPFIYRWLITDGKLLITVFYDEKDEVKEKVTTEGENQAAIKVSGPTGW